MEINFENLYNYLIQGLGVDKTLSFQQIRIIFVQALDDYFNSKINVETLSTLADNLVTKVGYKESDFSPDLNIALQAGYELEWYSKNKKDNEETLNEWLEDLKTFYQENKDLLKNFKK